MIQLFVGWEGVAYVVFFNQISGINVPKTSKAAMKAVYY